MHAQQPAWALHCKLCEKLHSPCIVTAPLHSVHTCTNVRLPDNTFDSEQRKLQDCAALSG